MELWRRLDYEQSELLDGLKTERARHGRRETRGWRAAPLPRQAWDGRLRANGVGRNSFVVRVIRKIEAIELEFSNGGEMSYESGNVDGRRVPVTQGDVKTFE